MQSHIAYLTISQPPASISTGGQFMDIVEALNLVCDPMEYIEGGKDN
ncbi:uncharacterized protein METZ01_LOCUS455930 [marine metagenome]|uniref:Uncharacterized protein n=1 Tax=marine metagenome TaxID=408172 RepID=A0A383A5B4_9ZZZZ